MGETFKLYFKNTCLKENKHNETCAPLNRRTCLRVANFFDDLCAVVVNVSWENHGSTGVLRLHKKQCETALALRYIKWVTIPKAYTQTPPPSSKGLGTHF